MQKPKLIRHEKGKLIYAIDGYVEFMNWLCESFYNLKGDADGKNSADGNVKIEWTDETHPVIKIYYS